MKEIIHTKIKNISITIIGISEPGSKEKENQDRFKIFVSNDSLIIAVADGLGSAIMSAIGAEAACDSMIEVFTNNLSFQKDFVNLWKQKITGDQKDYDTTIRFLNIRESKINFGCIGDGWTYILQGKEEYELHSKNEFLNCTESILSTTHREHYDVKMTPLMGNFIAVLATDGFSEDINMEFRKTMVEDFAKTMDESAELLAVDILEMIEEWPCKNNLDDKTVVIIRGKIDE